MLFSGSANEAGDVAELPINADLRGMMKASKMLMVLFFALAGMFILLAVSLVFLAIYQGLLANAMQDGLNLCLSVMGLLIFAVIFTIAGLIFKDISKGESPFTMKQARRIRIVAWMLIVYAVIEAVLPSGVVVDNSYAGSTINVNHIESSPPIIKVGSVIVGVVFYFLASVFTYGVKLQELSDETL